MSGLRAFSLPILTKKCHKDKAKRTASSSPKVSGSPSADTMLKPGTAIRPHIEEPEALALAEKIFGLKVTKIEQLDSYDDRNFKIHIKDGPVNEHIYMTSGEIRSGLQLKISNKLDSRCPQLLDAVARLMIYVNDCGIKVPRPLKSINGKYVCKVHLMDENREEGTYAARLFTFIPGKLFKDAPWTESLLFQLGATAAKLSKALQNYSDPILESRQTLWSLLNFAKLDDFLFAVQDPRRQNLIIEILSDYNEATAAVSLMELEWGIIHGDLNEQNLLIDQSGRVCDWRFSGIIDFGDVHQAPIIFDLAILCAHVMLGCMSMDPLCAPAHIISGYESIRPLNVKELHLLPTLIEARLAQCLTMGAYSYYQDPGNEYYLASAKRGWPLLSKIRSLRPNKIIDLWNEKQIYSVNDDLNY